jgi:hypothetical protein
MLLGHTDNHPTHHHGHHCVTGQPINQDITRFAFEFYDLIPWEILGKKKLKNL